VGEALNPTLRKPDSDQGWAMDCLRGLEQVGLNTERSNIDGESQRVRLSISWISAGESKGGFVLRDGTSPVSGPGRELDNGRKKAAKANIGSEVRPQSKSV
jgi:hypothetical protein